MLPWNSLLEAYGFFFIKKKKIKCFVIVDLVGSVVGIVCMVVAVVACMLVVVVMFVGMLSVVVVRMDVADIIGDIKHLLWAFCKLFLKKNRKIK